MQMALRDLELARCRFHSKRLRPESHKILETFKKFWGRKIPTIIHCVIMIFKRKMLIDNFPHDKILLSAPLKAGNGHWIFSLLPQFQLFNHLCILGHTETRFV